MLNLLDAYEHNDIDRTVMSHSQPNYVLEFSHAHIQLVQTLLFLHSSADAPKLMY